MLDYENKTSYIDYKIYKRTYGIINKMTKRGEKITIQRIITIQKQIFKELLFENKMREYYGVG